MASSKRWSSASGMELQGRSLLPSSTLSPLRQSSRRSVSRSYPATSLSRGLWPSSDNSKSSLTTSSSLLSSTSPSTLADHLTNDPLDNGPAPPQSLSRQRSCSELPRFRDDKTATAASDTKKIGKLSNNGRTLGSSMRFLPSSKPAGVTLTPGRVVPADLRKINNSDADIDIPSSESERSDASKASTPRIPKSPSPLITRTNSVRLLGSANTQWALSPGRQRQRASPPKTMTAVPELKGKKNLISLGWGHLFSRRKPAVPAAVVSSSPASRVASLNGAGEVGHQLRMMHGRLMQWRFVNARADAGGRSKLAGVEETLMNTWARVSELRGKVVRKRTQLDKERLHLKLNIILCSQMKALESWGNLESKHSSALASTKDCIQAAVCRLPLTNGAKVSLQSFALILGQVMDLAVMIKTIVRTFSPMAQDAASLVSELVRVVSSEQAMLHDCFELLGLASALQIEEESLRCHLVQL